MTTYDEELRDNFSRMATDEILARLASGHLTEVAKAIALAELKARRVDPDDPSSVVRYEEANRANSQANLREPLDGGKKGGGVK